MTLGSLFDGSGGFPLAGAINGIRPVWSSEIEAYPLRVTEARFPDVKQLGDVTKIDGAAIEAVDIITFGSPCQDLSVAGKQKGIHDGERSSLFFEAVRIAKEMRAHDRTTGRADVDVRPRFLVWENVPGAFSSNQGEDFRAVLEALGGIAEDGVSIPRPAKGKWQHAGCVVGDGWSIAWRLYDAQYWGVPQRRKRIYLVADLASERAGEILFERESLCGNPAESGETRQGVAGDAQGGAGGGCTAFHLQQDPISGNVSPCIGGQHQATVGVCGSFMGGQGAKAGGIAYSEGISPTIKSVMSGGNTVPDVVYPAVARTLTAEHDASSCVDRGQNMLIYTLQGNGIDRAMTAGCNGAGWREQVSYTLNTIDRHGVAFAAGFSDALGEKAQGGMGYTEEGMPTLRAGDVRSVVYDCRGNGDGEHVPMKKIPTLFERVYKDHKVVGINNEVTSGMEWVLEGKGEATVKFDGSCCAIINDVFYRRYDAKKGKKPPEDAIPCCEPDPVTGHHPHWVKVRPEAHADKWYVEALKNSCFAGDGTYEAIGTHFQGNPYGVDGDILVRHGCNVVVVERTFEGIREWLRNNPAEGLVFWLEGEPRCKIKRTDFGFEWPIKGGKDHDRTAEAAPVCDAREGEQADGAGRLQPDDQVPELREEV